MDLSQELINDIVRNLTRDWAVNAIMDAELEEAIHAKRQFVHSELTQLVETTVQMRKDLAKLAVQFF